VDTTDNILQVTPEDIETWLDIEPGQTVACRAEDDARRGPACAVTGAGLVLSLLLMSLGTVSELLAVLGVLLMFCSIGFGLFAASVMMPRSGPPNLIAGVHGLEVKRDGQWVHYPWDEVQRVEPEVVDRYRRVILSRGQVRVPINTTDGRRILAACEQVVAARHRGLLLPRLGPLPEGALSPVHDDEATDQRGLSRAGPG
jgi:hypothetical protein